MKDTLNHGTAGGKTFCGLDANNDTVRVGAITCEACMRFIQDNYTTPADLSLDIWLANCDEANDFAFLHDLGALFQNTFEAHFPHLKGALNFVVSED